MFPSNPAQTGRDPRADDGQAGPYPGAAHRSQPERSGPDGRPDHLDEATTGEPSQQVTAVPVRPSLSAAIAGFAALLGVGLVFGAHSAGPDARVPFTIVIFSVQVIFVLAWTMAMRPPALVMIAGVSVAVAAAADLAAVLPQVAALAPLGYVAAGGFLLAVLGQLVRAGDRSRVTESLGATLLIVVGVLAFATLIVLSRRPLGTQAIFVSLTATAVALSVARLTDAVLPRPRLAPQVPRGGAGVVLGAMSGTFAGALIGVFLVGFSPTSGALVGLITASAAVLADLAVGYSEAGRQMAGEAPTLWIARHMQGPLGGFALAAPAAYLMCVMLI